MVAPQGLSASPGEVLRFRVWGHLMVELYQNKSFGKEFWQSFGKSFGSCSCHGSSCVHTGEISPAGLSQHREGLELLERAQV